MRVNGVASIDFEDELMAEYPGAQFVVRVQPHDFPELPRYIHKMQLVVARCSCRRLRARRRSRIGKSTSPTCCRRSNSASGRSGWRKVKLSVLRSLNRMLQSSPRPGRKRKTSRRLRLRPPSRSHGYRHLVAVERRFRFGECRQAEAHGCAGAIRRVDPDLAAQAFDDALADRRPSPSPGTEGRWLPPR